MVPWLCSKTPKNLALVSVTPTCLSHKGETQIKEQLHCTFKTGMSFLSFPGAKIHSVHCYSKWSFSASQAFWLNIALYGSTLVPTVLPFLLMGIHTGSPVHNVILIPSIFKTLDLNVSNYPVYRYRFGLWPMVVRKLKPRAQSLF